MGATFEMISSKRTYRISFWPHTRNLDVASYRIRCHLVCKFLNRSGLSFTIEEPTDRNADVVVLSKRYDHFSLERALLHKERFGTKLILDICDNHFLHDESNETKRKKADELRKAIASVDLVIASTEYLRSIVHQECGSSIKTTVIGDLIEPPRTLSLSDKLRSPASFIELLRCKTWLESLSHEKSLRFIWFGNNAGNYHEAGMADLLKIKELMENLAKTHQASLTVVSDSYSKYRSLIENWRVPTFYLRWCRITFSSALHLHGTVVIPINSNPFTLAKSANRVTTALVHGLSVIADEIPSYTEFKSLIKMNSWEQSLNECAIGHTIAHREFNFVAHNQKIIRLWEQVLCEQA